LKLLEGLYRLFFLVCRRRGSDDTGKLVASVPTVDVLSNEAPSVGKGVGSGVMSSVGTNVRTSRVTGTGVWGIRGWCLRSGASDGVTGAGVTGGGNGALCGWLAGGRICYAFYPKF
jgi:hypothetical protein